jgi:hypothetical protein
LFDFLHTAAAGTASCPAAIARGQGERKEAAGGNPRALYLAGLAALSLPLILHLVPHTAGPAGFQLADVLTPSPPR